MSLETIITQLGYPGLVTGLLFEGETVLVLGAFMAHRGYMDLPLVILTALLVAFGSDQFFFWMRRTQGIKFLEKKTRMGGIPPCFFLASDLCTDCALFYPLRLA